MRIIVLLTILFLLELSTLSIFLNYQKTSAKVTNYELKEHSTLNNDLNSLDEDGETPLHKFALFCDIDWVKELIDRGANVDKLNEYGVPPIYYSITENCFTVTKILIDKGANVRWVDKYNGNNLLHYAAVLGTEQEIIMLIQAGLDLNGLNNDGESPIRVLLTWKDLSRQFKIDRMKFLQFYGAKNIYKEPSNNGNDSNSRPSLPKNTDMNKKKRKNRQEP